jgi:hypothetical protein
VIRAAALCGCWLLAACTQDFDAFEFEAEADGDRDEAVSGARDASSAGAGAGGRGGVDAGDTVDGLDASTGTGGADSGGEPPTGMTSDASAGDADAATDPGDAGAQPDPTCVTAWTDTTPGPASCGDCACSACTAPVLACLMQGSASEQSLCHDVVACALESGCRDDCYCQSAQCGAPDATGDGPCAAQMSAAAGGGGRNQVTQILSAADPNEPLVRAMQAVQCVLGASSDQPGVCELECQ